MKLLRKNGIAFWALILASACGSKTDTKESAKDSSQVNASQSLQSTSATNSAASGWESQEKLLQAIADEINDGTLTDFSRFYVNGNDIQKEPEMLPLMKQLANFHGSKTDKSGITQFMHAIPQRDASDIAKFFIIQPQSEHRNLYPNTFKTTRFSRLFAKKWQTHSGNKEYMYVRNGKICFYCEGHKYKHDHSISAAMIKTASGWKVAGKISIGHCT